MSTLETVRQKAGTVEGNPVCLGQEKAEQVIEALNKDLADVYVLYHQLHKHHWNVEGAEHLGIHMFLQEAYEEVEEAADEIAERIQAIQPSVFSASMNTVFPELTSQTETSGRSTDSGADSGSAVTACLRPLKGFRHT